VAGPPGARNGHIRGRPALMETMRLSLLRPRPLLRLLARSLVVAAVAISLTACKDKGDAAAAGKPGQYADVDCAKLMDHMIDVLLREGTQGQSDAQVTTATKKMKEQRPTMVAACEKEKPVKKMTTAQYDCVMKSSSTSEMAGCK
jgi:hypothetical protein